MRVISKSLYLNCTYWTVNVQTRISYVRSHIYWCYIPIKLQAESISGIHTSD